MSNTLGSYIYTGAWVNWSRGHVLGPTITVTQRNGGLLIAFLGIFVTIAGAACWRILCFLIHQWRADKNVKHDALYHQQQAILRNCTSPGSAAWQVSQVAWSWRGIARSPVWRNLPLIILAVLNMSLFGLAGIFSSEITKAAGNETLLMSHNCGWLNSDNDTTKVYAISRGINQTLAASLYSRACYGENRGNLECSRFARSRIDFSTKKNVSCPFDERMCIDGPTSAFQVESTLVDSHNDLGMNARKSERVQYRKTSTCTVIPSKDFYEETNTTTLTNETVPSIRYKYGSRIDGSGIKNFTFEYAVNDAEGLNGYTLRAIKAISGDSLGWIPIKELSRDDADVTLIFLAQNRVTYNKPVIDPWYMATRNYSDLDFQGNDQTLYLPSKYVSILACADQFQLCNPNNDKCTPKTSAFKATSDTTLEPLDFNAPQTEAMDPLAPAIEYLQDTYATVESRGAVTLRASDTLGANFLNQDSLPTDQWTLEVTEWFAMSMARLQQFLVDYAAGSRYQYPGTHLAPGKPNICEHQKIRSAGGYISFSIFGLALIVAISFTLIFTALAVDTVVGAAQSRWDWQDHKRLQWAVDEKLQLQRLAFEGAGQGFWTRGANAVPVTTRSESIGLPPELSRTHPSLRRKGEGRGGKSGSLDASGIYGGEGKGGVMDTTRLVGRGEDV